MAFLLRFALVGALVALWIYCVLDVLRAEPERIPYLPKTAWLAIVALFAPVGSAAWLVLGKHPATGTSITGPRPSASAPAPDDSPDYLRQVDEEIRRRRRAQQIRNGDVDPGDVDDEIRRFEDEFGDGEDGPTA